MNEVLVNEVLERTDRLEELRSLVEDGHPAPRVAAECRPEQIVDAQSC